MVSTKFTAKPPLIGSLDASPICPLLKKRRGNRIILLLLKEETGLRIPTRRESKPEVVKRDNYEIHGVIANYFGKMSNTCRLKNNHPLPKNQNLFIAKPKLPV
jgi:hypothetical protein